MPNPTLRNVWNVIAFLEQNPDDIHSGLTNQQVANSLRGAHDAYVEGPNKKMTKETGKEGCGSPPPRYKDGCIQLG